jgi:O-succinylbenzoic acid--CoA ligase
LVLLTLNNNNYTQQTLLQLCEEKVSSQSTPTWERDIYIFIQEWLSDADYIEVKTSGSTGKPKNIKLKKRWLEYSASQTCNFFNLNSQSSALLCLPAAYIAGRMMIVRAFVSGMNLVTVEPSSNPFINHPFIQPSELAARQSSNQPNSKLANHSLDFTALTPFQLHQSLQTLKSNPLVKSIIVGGGEVSTALEKEVQDLPIDIYATYGMTETSSHIALRRVNDSERKESFTIIGHTKINIDERGCLIIENPFLFEGRLVTNDIVEVLNSKEFRWLGRYDNIINSGGIKIMPEEVEKAISNLVPQSIAISSIPHHTLGEAVVLVIESAELKNDEKKSLLLHIKKLVHSYAIPKQIYSLSEIPRTPTGKIDRREIKERLK